MKDYVIRVIVQEVHRAEPPGTVPAPTGHSGARQYPPPAAEAPKPDRQAVTVSEITQRVQSLRAGARIVSRLLELAADGAGEADPRPQAR